VSLLAAIVITVITRWDRATLLIIFTSGDPLADLAFQIGTRVATVRDRFLRAKQPEPRQKRYKECQSPLARSRTRDAFRITGEQLRALVTAIERNMSIGPFCGQPVRDRGNNRFSSPPISPLCLSVSLMERDLSCDRICRYVFSAAPWNPRRIRFRFARRSRRVRDRKISPKAPPPPSRAITERWNFCQSLSLGVFNRFPKFPLPLRRALVVISRYVACRYLLPPFFHSRSFSLSILPAFIPLPAPSPISSFFARGSIPLSRSFLAPPPFLPSWILRRFLRSASYLPPPARPRRGSRREITLINWSISEARSSSVRGYPRGSTRCERRAQGRATMKPGV